MGAPLLTTSEAKRFSRIVEGQLIAGRLAFSGTAPLLVDRLGREMFLGNLGAR